MNKKPKAKPDLEYLKKHSPVAYAKLMAPKVEAIKKDRKQKRQERLDRIRSLMESDIKLGGE